MATLKNVAVCQHYSQAQFQKTYLWFGSLSPSPLRQPKEAWELENSNGVPAGLLRWLHLSDPPSLSSSLLPGDEFQHWDRIHNVINIQKILLERLSGWKSFGEYSGCVLRSVCFDKLERIRNELKWNTQGSLQTIAWCQSSWFWCLWTSHHQVYNMMW